MKITQLGILLSLPFLIHPTVKAQTTAEAFLAQLPSVPNSVCNADTSLVNGFTNKINSVKSIMQQKVDRIHEEAESGLKKTKEKILGHVAQQSGFSKNDMSQLMQENLSEEKTNQLINKSLNHQYNLSMDELEKVGKMSDADREKWARNYANKSMQRAMENPQETLKKQEKSDKEVALVREHKAIADRITEKIARQDKLLRNIELQDTIASRNLRERIRPVVLALRQVPDGAGATPATIRRARELERQIYNLKIQYCERMSPLQLNYIMQCQTDLKILLPDYRRAGEIENEISVMQYGANIFPVQLNDLSAVEKFTSVLSQAYKYWIGKFDQ